MTLIYHTLKELIFLFKFKFIIFRKWIALLLKKNRKLEKQSLSYFKNWHSEYSYLVIDFNFLNAIYFKVGDTKSFDFSIPLILNLNKHVSKNIKVEVYGFCQKQVYIIEPIKEVFIDTNPFKTNIDNFSSIEIFKPNNIIKLYNLQFAREKPKVNTQNISVKTNNISIYTNKFIMQEHI